MAPYLTCNLCQTPGSFASAKDVKKISCNVRKFKTEYFTVWRCTSCGSLHTLEDVDLSPYYDGYPMQSQNLDFWSRCAYKNLLKRLISLGIKRNDEILDFGCGIGLFIDYLNDHGFNKTSGYDANVSKFSQKNNTNKEYDVIITQDVVEHLDNPDQIIDQLSNNLRPGGLLCVGTPNADKIDLSKGDKHSLSLHQPYHRHILSEKALCYIASKSGLTVEKVYYRWYYDTHIPTVNQRFMATYIEKCGGLLDSAFESPNVILVLKSPILWFYAFFGYFFPQRSEMMIAFRKPRQY